MLIRRLEGENARMSHVRTVLSIEFERRDCPSGETLREVIMSWWPRSVYETARFLTSRPTKT